MFVYEIDLEIKTMFKLEMGKSNPTWCDWSQPFGTKFL